MPPRKPTKKSSSTASRISKARLAAIIEAATVDAYGDSEQATGWYTMLEEHLALPFETTVLGVVVKVVALDLRGDNDIVAICTRGICRFHRLCPQVSSGSRRTVTGSGVDYALRSGLSRRASAGDCGTRLDWQQARFTTMNVA